MDRMNRWFWPGEGINREVISADIQRYLGLDALVRPGEHEGSVGYWITSHRAPTALMVEDLRLDSQLWEEEKGEKGSRAAYQDSRTHASRQHYGPSASYLPDHSSAYPFGHSQQNQGMIQNTPIAPEWISHAVLGDMPPLHRESISSNGNDVPAKSPHPLPISNFSHPLPNHGYGNSRGQSNISQSATYSTKLLVDEPRLLNFFPERSLSMPPTQEVISSPPVVGVVNESQLPPAQTAKVYNEPAESIAYRCGWLPPDGTRFRDVTPNVLFENLRHLGKGSAGEVDEVRVPAGGIVLPTLARKRIKISRAKKPREQELSVVNKEIAHLRAAVHLHIVKAIGSYYEESPSGDLHANLLTYPVGEDLQIFIHKALLDQRDISYRQQCFRKWFICLASALECMHRLNIQHKDIKPSNIIHCAESVYFTDFSSSRTFESGQTTTDSYSRTTRLYRAPEISDTRDGDHDMRHGNSSDVFSLGLVFVEMLTVIEGLQVHDLHDYIYEYNDFGVSAHHREYWRTVNCFQNWFTTKEGVRMYLHCIKPMLLMKRRERPSAKEVARSIFENEPWGSRLDCPCIWGV
ncbi:kinase-like protein [Byssothecium circinans]|uniref:Kinase-like protein n=1 Tax=Byssothecium circinans TaxID=147558 RepID=A0A6A5UGR2_9PLEO|nr:kinase-like protein [Byssothecium circinans]